MRVFTCLAFEHNLWFVFLAALMCALGSLVTINLVRRAASTAGLPRNGWLFLTAVSAGSSIWATHFIAMLGYEVPVTVSINPVLTLASALIAIFGAGLGFAIASIVRSRTANILGGGIVGLSVSAMHYTGMFGYRVQGVVTWDPAYIVASLALACLFSIAAMEAMHRWSNGIRAHAATGLLILAIVSLHFTGMAAFQVEPILTLDAGLAADALYALAMAVLIVGLIILGTGISSYLIDDRNRADSTEKLRLMAFQDPLTGLANRRALQDRMNTLLKGTRPFSMLLLDLDHFKNVNDTYGHAVGDQLLVQVTRRLSGLLAEDSFAARIGGDELAVLVTGSKDNGWNVAQAAVQVLIQPYLIDGLSVVVGCSIGLSAFPDANSHEEIMRQADIALYEAKRLGRGRAFPYEPGMLEAVEARYALESDLKAAILHHQFYLAYQPLVDLATKQPIGFEALIRWEHPTRGLVSPADFIPLAEECGCIVEIGQWVLLDACREAMTWDDHLHVAVNVSAVQFKTAAFLSHVTQALAASGLPAHRLEIELTETAMVTDGPRVAMALSALRMLGVKISMDDFGTGYSSLAHLRDLPLDRIKIDRSFVSAAASDPNSMAVLQAITQLGRTMNIPTLAEGVETDEQVEMLQNLGCDAVQGFLFGRPARSEHAHPSDKRPRCDARKQHRFGS